MKKKVKGSEKSIITLRFQSMCKWDCIPIVKAHFESALEDSSVWYKLNK